MVFYIIYRISPFRFSSSLLYIASFVRLHFLLLSLLLLLLVVSALCRLTAAAASASAQS